MPPIPLTYKRWYVKQQRQSRVHHCHWPGCGKQVKPALWGCYHHWMRLPKHLRDAIWACYRPGQEVTGTPSVEYVRAARAARDWVREHYPETKAARHGA